MLCMGAMKIRFSDFVLDEERYLLERAGRRVALRPKVFDLLIELVRNRARVLRREELIETLWGGTAVGSGSLSGLVNELRQALGEDGRGRSSIRTVHARGYQFVAEVEPDRVDVREVDAVAEPSCVASADASRASVDGEGGALTRSIDALFARVSESGAVGRVVTPSERSELARLVARAPAFEFAVDRVRVPEGGMAGASELVVALVAGLCERFGERVVRSALPPPARGVLERVRIAGSREAGSAAERRCPGDCGQPVPDPVWPPIDLLATGVGLLDELARRQPTLLVVESIERAGPDVASALVRMLDGLADSPVLLIAVSSAPIERDSRWWRVLSHGGHFAHGLRSDVRSGSLGDGETEAGGRACFDAWFETRGLAPPPVDVSRPLTTQLGHDRPKLEDAAEALWRWRMGRGECESGPGRAARTMRKVDAGSSTFARYRSIGS